MDLGHTVEVLLPMIQEAEDELKKLDTTTIGVQLGLAPAITSAETSTFETENGRTPSRSSKDVWPSVGLT